MTPIMSSTTYLPSPLILQTFGVGIQGSRFITCGIDGGCRVLGGVHLLKFFSFRHREVGVWPVLLIQGVPSEI